MSDEANIHRALGALEGQFNALNDYLKQRDANADTSRVQLHKKVEEINVATTLIKSELDLITGRVNVLEPAVSGLEAFRQRWKIYTAIALAIWVFVSAVIAPVIGGYLQHLLQLS